MDGPALDGAPAGEGLPAPSTTPELPRLGGVNMAPPGPTLREIHKVGCLKHIPHMETRRITPFSKPPKVEKVWVAFCMHSSKDAYLEFYDSCQKIAGHEPLSKFELSKCLHISPSLLSEEEHYEFAITLVSHVVRLAAPTRDTMMDWIDTIRTKLQDLGVLEPKDNVYSGDPVPVQPPHDTHLGSRRRSSSNEETLEEHIVGRNPNSPLPPVPAPQPPPVPPRGPTAAPSSVFTFDATSVSVLETRHAYLRSASLDSDPTSPDGPRNLSAPETPSGERAVYEPLFRPLVAVARVNSWSSPSRPRYASSEPRNKRLSYAAPSPLNSQSDLRPCSSNMHRERASSSTREAQTNSDVEIPSTSAAEAVQSSSASRGQHQCEESSQALTLKEAQVLRLRKEISHECGVRLVVRKRDCLHAVAFVECFGAVWVAGWNQKDHPLLHNVFHIGDQLQSVGNIRVSTVQEVVRVTKCQAVTVEFVVRRLPFAKVFAIKRDVEGQDLGLVRERGTPEIAEVKPEGLAAKHGLPHKATTVDGTGLCNWFLTEVNCRPLNLFFKNHEVQDRLNAVGKDISILVQPSDFVHALKKQLKSLRGYKEFIVQ